MNLFEEADSLDAHDYGTPDVMFHSLTHFIQCAITYAHIYDGKYSQGEQDDRELFHHYFTQWKQG